MKDELVAAQVGCGAFARAQHGPNMVRNPHVGRIKWACDLSEKNAAAYAKKFGAENVTAAFEQAVTDPEVDIVCIATSHEVHVPIIEAAAAAGKHVFCEKPMAIDEAQAWAILRAVKRSGIKLCVDYMRRSSPAVVALKREWRKHLENPTHQPWRYIEKPREKFIEEQGTDFNIRVQDESASYRLVHLDPEKGGGLIIGEAVHWIDLACWLFDGDLPVEISAWGSTRMRYGIHIGFQSGSEATITMTPNGTFDYPKEVYEIACNAALFRMEFFVENQYYGRPGLECETFPLQFDPCPEIGGQGGLDGYLEKYRHFFRDADNARDRFNDLQPDHGYEAIFDGFIDAILGDAPVPCDATAGYRATMLGRLAMQSIELRHAVAVPPEKWDVYLDV